MISYGYFKWLGDSWNYTGADPGLILGCCNNFTKEIEHRNDVICRKIIDSAKKQEGTVLITVRVQIWR